MDPRSELRRDRADLCRICGIHRRGAAGCGRSVPDVSDEPSCGVGLHAPDEHVAESAKRHLCVPCLGRGPRGPRRTSRVADDDLLERDGDVAVWGDRDADAGRSGVWNAFRQLRMGADAAAEDDPRRRFDHHSLHRRRRARDSQLQPRAVGHRIPVPRVSQHRGHERGGSGSGSSTPHAWRTACTPSPGR